MPLYRVTVSEHRLYKVVYKVEADSPEEAEELVDNYDERAEEVSDEMTDCTSSTFIGCEEVPE